MREQSTGRSGDITTTTSDDSSFNSLIFDLDKLLGTMKTGPGQSQGSEDDAALTGIERASAVTPFAKMPFPEALDKEQLNQEASNADASYQSTHPIEAPYAEAPAPYVSDAEALDAPASTTDVDITYEDVPDAEDMAEDASASVPESKATPVVSKASRRRRFRFYKVLLIIMAVFFVAIGVGTYYFWGYIGSYEDSRLEHILTSFQENIEYDFWEQNAENAIASRLTAFEEGRPIPLEQHLPKIRDVRYTLRNKTDESTPDAPVYFIRAGAQDIGIVRLTATEGVGYGFYKWDVGSVEFLDSFVDTFCRSITITASQNALVYVNGINVSLDYLIACDFDYARTYQIPGIFGDVEISVYEFDGMPGELLHIENEWHFYQITIPFSREYNILAPEGIPVFVNGEQVPLSFITDDRIVPSVFIGAIDISQAPVHLHRYEFQINGVYVEPVVYAADASGRELLATVSDNGEILFSLDYSQDYKERHSDAVEAFIRAYVSFAANAGGNVGSNVENLSNHMLRNSELHRRVRSARASMQWVGGTTVIFNSIEMDYFRPYGDTYFSCEVSYSITNRTRAGARELEGRFEVLFVLSGNRWLAVSMVAL